MFGLLRVKAQDSHLDFNPAALNRGEEAGYMIIIRCDWATGSDARMLAYHDEEWGFPLHDDRRLFEFLVLEGAQAGLSWQTILNKRDGYRGAFAEFDPVRVARSDRRRVEALLKNPAIVRNRLKVESAISNARALLAGQKEFGSFA